LASGGDEKTPPANRVVFVPKPPPPPEIKPKDVQIELRGLPVNARIYYDDAPIPLNPFRVTLKEVIVPLKVEAEGYEDYVTSVVPAEDQVVKIEMKKKEVLQDTEAAEVETPPTKIVETTTTPSHKEKSDTTKTKSSKKKQDNNDDVGFTKINKKIKISNEFE
jgi:hypothetical protein